MLYFLFSYQLFIFLLALRVECSIISEEVKLLKISFAEGAEASSITWFAVMFNRRMSKLLSVIRSNNSPAESMICFVEEV